jgi:hypothetical protein
MKYSMSALGGVIVICAFAIEWAYRRPSHDHGFGPRLGR